MAKFSLHIETSDVAELAEIALRIAVGSGGAVGAAAGETPAADFHGSSPQLDEPKATPAADKPRRGRPAKTEAAPAPAAPAADPVAEPVAVAEPAPVAPAAPAAAPTGEITYDTLKETLTQVLGVKSAKDAQDIIREATGGRAASLTQCQVEDYPVVVAALRAVLQ